MDAVGLHGYPGGGAPVVVQDGGPLWDHGLLEIVFRDRPPHGGEPVPNPLGRGLVVHQGPAKGLGHGDFGEVVTGGAQPPVVMRMSARWRAMSTAWRTRSGLSPTTV